MTAPVRTRHGGLVIPAPGLTAEETAARYRQQLDALLGQVDLLHVAPYAEVRGIIQAVEHMYGGRAAVPCLLAQKIGRLLRLRPDYLLWVERKGL